MQDILAGFVEYWVSGESEGKFEHFENLRAPCNSMSGMMNARPRETLQVILSLAGQF